MQLELGGAARTASHVSFRAEPKLGLDLIIEQAVQEDIGFVAIHFRLPSAITMPSAAWNPKRKAAGPQAGRASTWGPGGLPIRRHCPGNVRRGPLQPRLSQNQGRRSWTSMAPDSSPFREQSGIVPHSEE